MSPLAIEAVGGLAFLLAFWRQCKAVAFWLYSIFVTTVHLEGELYSVVVSYLVHTAKSYRTVGHVRYGSAMMWIRPLDTVARVVYRVLGATQVFYAYKGRWIWNIKSDNAGHVTDLGFSFLRGAINWPVLLQDAVAYEKDLRESSTSRGRFFIKKVVGRSAAKLAELQRNVKAETAHPSGRVPETGFNRTNGWELVHYGWDEVGAPQSPRAVDQLALTPELEAMVEQIRFWLDGRDWHEEHGVPWRLSLLWTGAPGTGKTSLARALGEAYDLPIYSFLLGTLSDDEFIEAWDEMLTSTPCIAFLDDIDRTFNGDKNVVNPKGLSYATLLQALDGIERANGLLLIATANHPEKLDSALVGEPVAEGDMPTRPGRIDEVVVFPSLAEAGRQKLAARIVDDPEVAARLVAEGARDTGAQFQLRCVQAARAAWLEKLRRKVRVMKRSEG